MNDLAAQPDPSAAAPLVMVLAPTGRDAPVTCRLLEQAGIACEAVGSVDELCIRMDQEGGVAVVAEEALDAHAMRRLESVLEHRPSWSDPPLVLLGGRLGPPHRLRPLAARRSTSVLRRPLHVGTFLSVVRAALENRRRQLEVRDLLVDLKTTNQNLALRAHQLQALALQLTEAEEQERRRLAALLHDNLQQLLAAAGFRVMAMQGAGGDFHRVWSQLDSLRQLLGDAGDLARDLSRELDPPGLRRGGLVPALEWLQRQMEEHHGLHIELQAPREAEPDDDRLNRVLFRSVRELLFNVVKHAGCERARLELRRDGGTVIVRVEDDGCGFDPATVSAPADAVGFGVLSIRERADLLGGGLYIDSRPGAGTRIELRLPADESVPKLSEHAESRRERPERAPAVGRVTGRGVRVLLVDDHAVMRQGLRALLADEPGIEVVGEASNGAEAVAAVARLRPDVVVMDASMPVMDGPAATRRIHALHPEVRIVGLSMFDDSEMAETMRAAGAESYLCKSGAGDDLIAAVRGRR